MVCLAARPDIHVLSDLVGENISVRAHGGKNSSWLLSSAPCSPPAPPGCSSGRSPGRTGCFRTWEPLTVNCTGKSCEELALIPLCSCASRAILGDLPARGAASVPTFSGGLPGDGPYFWPEAHLLSPAFAACVEAMLFLLEGRFVCRTNIIDIVQELHTSEPIREVKGWRHLQKTYRAMRAAVRISRTTMCPWSPI